MKPESQRIAIVEACGWDYDKRTDQIVFTRGGDIHGIPWPSLDAMHEAEKSLSRKDEGPSASEWRRYLMNMESVISGPSDRFGDRPDRTMSVPHATSAQRAEAFLKTIGKWDYSK